MLCKILGTLALLCAGGYVSLSVNRYEHRRLAVLDGYIALIYYIKGQIDCYAMPLADILTRADPTLIAACLGGDSPALPPSPGEGGAYLPALLRESRLYLTPECERLLRGFSGELGTTYRAEQVARCEHYLAVLTHERSRLSDAIPARLRTCGTLCICCAVALSLLLW